MGIRMSSGLAFGLAMLLAASHISAQAPPRIIDPSVLMHEFEHEVVSADLATATALITQMMLYPDRFRSADVSVVFRDLERLARESPSSPVRSQAARSFAMAGMSGGSSPRADMVARLERLYAQTTDPEVKLRIIGTLRAQADRRAAVRFLSRIIVDTTGPSPPRGPGDHTPGQQAVGVLAAMGAEGQGELRRLHAQARITDPWARALLNDLATRGDQNRR